MGIILSILVAFIDAFNNTFLKKSLKKHSTLVVSLAWTAFSLLILLPVLLIVGIPSIQASFWRIAVVKVVLQTLALVLYAASLKRSDMSRALPMLAFTPVFTLIISYFVNHDIPSVSGVLGVCFIFLGVFLLNTVGGRRGIDTPLASIYQNRGVFSMFLVSFLWSVTTSFDKLAVKASSPIFYSTSVAIAIMLILVPLVVYYHKNELFQLIKPRNFKLLFRVGILEGLLQFTQMTAVGLTLAAYVIAIKRSSIIFSSVLGYLVFKEKIKGRILPITLMFFGILLIVLFK